MIYTALIVNTFNLTFASILINLYVQTKSIDNATVFKGDRLQINVASEHILIS